MVKSAASSLSVWAPVQPATADPVLGHEGVQIGKEVVGDIVPEVFDGLFAALAFEIFE